MKAIDCYWQDWSIRIDAPESTFYCEDADVTACVSQIRADASPTKIAVKELHQSEGQAPLLMKPRKDMV